MLCNGRIDRCTRCNLQGGLNVHETQATLGTNQIRAKLGAQEWKTLEECSKNMEQHLHAFFLIWFYSKSQLKSTTTQVQVSTQYGADAGERSLKNTIDSCREKYVAQRNVRKCQRGHDFV